MKELYRLRRSLNSKFALRQPPLPPTAWGSSFGPRVLGALDLLEALVRSCLAALTPDCKWLSHPGAESTGCCLAGSNPVSNGHSAANNEPVINRADNDSTHSPIEFDQSLLDFFRYPNDAAGMSSPNCYPHIDRGVRSPEPGAHAHTAIRSPPACSLLRAFFPVHITMASRARVQRNAACAP